MFRMRVLILLLFPLYAFGQGQGTGEGITGAISGVVLDSMTRQAVSFASVGVYLLTSRKVVDGGITDEKGNFKITGLAMGEYRLKVIYIGHSPKEVNDLALTDQKPDLNCGDILISPQTQLLEEIKVIGESALIEARPDKIVYNADKDITARGGDAADVLRNVPLLTVDFDGNVSMRGSENVRILINGRPSGIFNASVADALKMMPADQIKAVEVITAPSAKYDGEGTAGIINIITRKKNIEGLAGSVDLTGGTRSNRGNMNLNYGKGRLGVNISGGGHYRWPQEGTTSFRRDEFGLTSFSLLTQDGTNTSSRLGYRISGGLQYDINAYNTINSTFSYRGHDVDSKNDVLSSYSEDGNVLEVYRRTTDGFSTRGGWDWDADYRKTFKKEGQEWAVAFELDKDDDNSNSDYHLQYAIPLTEPDALENNNDLGDNIEFTGQSDYTHPFSKALFLETGLKATIRMIKSDFSFLEFDPDVNTWIEDPSRTDIFYYDQNVYAGYISSNAKLGEKTTLIAGLRLEITDLQGDFKSFDSRFKNTYINLLPNVTLSRKVGEFNQIRISYNQRIQRPNQRNINPFVQYNDDRDISYGNPVLGPEFVQQVEIGTNVFINGNMVNFTLFGRRTEDLIESLLKINESGVSETTFENFGVRSAIGLNAFGSVNIGKKLIVRGGFDINIWNVEGVFEGENLANNGFDYNGRITITYSLTETLKMEGFSFFRSPTYTVQGKLPNWVMSSFAIKQELFKKKLVIGVNVSQPFQENLTWESELSGDDFYQNNTTVRPVRSFGLNLGYRFGKLDFNERTGKKRINNNDLKEEPSGVNQF